MIGVLIVEDSLTARELLRHILSSDPEIQVIGAVGSGEEALAFIARKKPDVITMDIMMPGLDGIETTRRIMETTPVPVVVVSAHLDTEEAVATFRLMEAGALAVVEKPAGLLSPDFERTAREIVLKVKAMSEVRLIRRHARPAGRSAPAEAEARRVRPAGPIEIVAMGGSTGAPIVFQRILGGLPGDLPVPVVMVQHIASGFIDGMVRWLQQSTALPVGLASDGERLRPGLVYVAPESVQMVVKAGGTVSLSDDPPEHGLRPAVSYLFRSVARAYGGNAIGVLLTGMGADGAEELKMMKERGAVTIAQDRDSSVVHGMPGEAIRLGGAALVLKPEEISAAIIRLVDGRR